MSLVDQYVKAVRMYLQKAPHHDDILAELREHLQSRLDEEQEIQGRPLTELEQEAILTRHGNPMLVAERYGAPRRSVAFGWQLIGPELFPLFVRILLLNWTVTIVAVPIIMYFVRSLSRLSVWTFAGPLLVQLLVVTFVFTCVDAVQRRARWRPSRSRQLNWRFPPPYLQAIPQWQSLAGGLVFSLLIIWLSLVPFVPALLFGRAAGSVAFSPSASVIYWPVLALLVVSTAQRAATFARPDWNWLQAVTRLLTNSAMLVLLYPFAMNFPYVLASPSAPDAIGAEHLVQRINSTMWWMTMGTMSVYWLFNVLFHLWLCAQFVRYAGRRRAEEYS